MSDMRKYLADDATPSEARERTEKQPGCNPDAYPLNLPNQDNTSTPLDFTEQEFPEPPDIIWLRHDGAFWHAVTTARLPDSPQYVRVRINNDFTEQARQLVNEATNKYGAIYPTQALVDRIASFASEAVTQGQIVGVQRAAEHLEHAVNNKRDEIRELKDVNWSTLELEHYAEAFRKASVAIRALSPDPSYLDRVRNETATATIAKYFCNEHQKLLSESEVKKFVCFWCVQNKIAERETEATTAAEWQPIETAPKDGTQVLLGHGNSIWVDEWIPDADYEVRNGEGGCWMMCDQWADPEIPSHWQPLPPLPIAAIGDKE